MKNQETRIETHFVFAVQRWNANQTKDNLQLLQQRAKALKSEAECEAVLVTAANFFAEEDFCYKYEKCRKQVELVQKWITAQNQWLIKPMSKYYGVCAKGLGR